MRLAAALLLAAGTAGAQDERRFFATEVDFWGRPPRARAAILWRGETPPPPGPARDLLEAPTPENARRYLDWQRERLDRLRKAIEALEAAGAGDESAEILGFTRDDCPYCRLQAAMLAGLPVRWIRPGQAPELWAKYGVTATPTLVANGRVFRGVTARKTIESAAGSGKSR
jgi:hypothetical protein